MWQSFSGSVIGQLMASYRFLGLMDDTGKPTRPLQNLVSEPDSQVRELNRLIQQAYPELMVLKLEVATPKHLADAFMENYGVTGATLQKAVSFFLQAAQYAELGLSPYLTKRKGRKRRNAKRSGPEASAGMAITESGSAPSAATRSVKLLSGGNVSLSVRFDAFSISEQDRAFVFGLIDQLANYEKIAVRDQIMGPGEINRILSDVILKSGTDEADAPYDPHGRY